MAFFAAENVLCVQHNFILLQDEMPGTKDEIPIIDHMYKHLDEDNLSDIKHQVSARRQKAKLLKILMMKGDRPCFELLNVFVEDLDNANLVNEMIKWSADVKKRGNSYVNHLNVCD